VFAAAIVTAFFVTTSFFSASAPAQTGASSPKAGAESEQVIIARMPARDSKVRQLLSRLVGKAKGHKLEISGSELWTVSKEKSGAVTQRLEQLGAKVTRLSGNWTQILQRNTRAVELTPKQQGVIDRVTRSPETIKVGVLNMPDVAAAEHALTRFEEAVGTRGQGGPPEDRYAKVVLPLDRTRDITLVRTRPTVKTERGLTWTGETEETGERALLMLWMDGHLSGYFGYKGRVFVVNHMGGTVHTMAEMDPAMMPPDHAPASNSPGRDSSPAQPATPRPSPKEPEVAAFPEAERKALEGRQVTIDVMLLYTVKAGRNYVRDPADLLAMAIEQANETFRNSGIGNVSLRLVHSQEIDYDEAGADQFDHLYRMVDGLGPFRDMKRLRDEKRADIVG
jgi:hypothetical protein